MKKKLRALLVGIDEYEYINGLNGCLNDVANMENYLKSREDFETDIKILTNEKATKKNIVDTFTSHLIPAGKDELTLFFFAGHGTEEKTEINAFRNSSATNNISAFFCYGSDPSSQADPEKTCLADKEMRYLINKLSKNGSDLYVIIDCCHSGGISRSFKKSRKVTNDPIDARTWEGYIFHEDPAVRKEDLESKPLPEVLPEGNQVQISACRDVELAWEHTGEDFKPGGLFSISLIKALKSMGPMISTYKLKNQVSNFLRGWPENDNLQTPQIHIVSEDPAKRFQGFLGVELEKEPFRSQIVYNPHQGWILGLGQIHGLDGSDEENMPTCNIFIGPDKKQEQAVTLTEVLPTFAKLEPEDSWNLDPALAYPCEVNINVDPIVLYIDAEEQVKESIVQQLTAEMEEKGSSYLEFEDDEDWADYTLRFTDSAYNITLPQDQKPLIQAGRVKRGKVKIETLFNKLGHIAKWEFLKKSRNDNTQLGKDLDPALGGKPIQIEFFGLDKNGNKQALPIKGDAVNLALTRTGRDGNPAGGLGITITNKSERELFCGLIHLSMDFGVSVGLLDPSGVFLGPGQSYSIGGGRLAPVSLSNYIYIDNWVGSTDYIKLIASTTHFDLIPLGMDPLPEPHKSNRANIKWGEDESLAQKDDWIAYEVELLIVNPKYEMKGEEREMASLS